MNNERKYKIIFFAPACLPMDETMILRRPLESLETGIIGFALGLANLGHQVIVYTSNRETPKNTNENLEFISVKDFNNYQNECDIFIVVRELQGLLLDVPCRAKFFYTGDAFNAISTYGLGDKRYINRIHALICKSKWQKQTLCESSGFPLERAVALGDFVDIENFEGIEQRNRKRLIFTSAPYKGLKLVIPLLERIQKEEPKVEFHCFSGLNIYDGEKTYIGNRTKERDLIISELEKLPNVFIHGNVLQKELAREYMKSAVLFYPCTWLSTGCKVLMEAQASGTPIITTNLGAMPEIIGDAGLVVQDEIGSKEFFDNFTNGTLKLLQDDDMWSKLSLNGKMRAQKYFSKEVFLSRFANMTQRLNL